MRLISKVKPGRWKCQHSDGAVTYHKTKKAAQEYVHTIHTFLPWDATSEDRINDQ
jgi:hypothetical protein